MLDILLAGLPGELEQGALPIAHAANEVHEAF